MSSAAVIALKNAIGTANQEVQRLEALIQKKIAEKTTKPDLIPAIEKEITNKLTPNLLSQRNLLLNSLKELKNLISVTNYNKTILKIKPSNDTKKFISEVLPAAASASASSASASGLNSSPPVGMSAPGVTPGGPNTGKSAAILNAATAASSAKSAMNGLGDSDDEPEAPVAPASAASAQRNAARAVLKTEGITANNDDISRYLAASNSDKADVVKTIKAAKSSAPSAIPASASSTAAVPSDAEITEAIKTIASKGIPKPTIDEAQKYISAMDKAVALKKIAEERKVVSALMTRIIEVAATKPHKLSHAELEMIHKRLGNNTSNERIGELINSILASASSSLSASSSSSSSSAGLTQVKYIRVEKDIARNQFSARVMSPDEMAAKDLRGGRRRTHKHKHHKRTHKHKQRKHARTHRAHKRQRTHRR